MRAVLRRRKGIPGSAGTAVWELVEQYTALSQDQSVLDWGEPSEQQVLDTALAYSVINHHFDVADFLLAHGADINTRWGSHEPASILHELVGRADYEGMQFLIDHGIDMTIKDYRWGSTAAGWAYYAMKDEKMTQWLTDAEKRRKEPR